MDKIFECLGYMNEDVHSMKENVSSILDIVSYSSESKEVTELLTKECRLIKDRIKSFETFYQEIQKEIERLDMFKDSSSVSDIPSTSREPTPMETDEKDKISLRPQKPQKDKGKQVQFDIPRNLLDIQHSEVQTQVSKMMELWELTDNDYRFVDFSGLYPRVNYLQIAPPQEVKIWYDFGAVNCIYTAPPDFHSLSALPKWIKEKTNEYYIKNPTISRKDILSLKFVSSGPDFYEDERYPAYHFIQIGKVETLSFRIPKVKNQPQRFAEENDIHFRRAIGMRIILQTMEATFKRTFRTYSGPYQNSPVMVGFAKNTPAGASTFLTRKMEMIDKGIIKSSPAAQKKLCKYRDHKKNTCPECTYGDDDAREGTFFENSIVG